MDHNGMLSAYQFQRQYLTLLVEDIPEEKMTFQPAGVVNHPAWQLAHLAVVQDRLVQILGGKTRLEPDWENRFGRGSTPARPGHRIPPGPIFWGSSTSAGRSLCASSRISALKSLPSPRACPAFRRVSTAWGCS